MATDFEKSYYGNHGVGCMCPVHKELDGFSKRAKNDDGGEEGRKALLQAMFHEGKAQEHRQIVFGPDAKKIPDDQKLKHMEAAASHEEAADHFRSARWQLRDGFPKAAQERLDMAAAPAAKGKKLSEELGVS